MKVVLSWSRCYGSSTECHAKPQPSHVMLWELIVESMQNQAAVVFKQKECSAWHWTGAINLVSKSLLLHINNSLCFNMSCCVALELEWFFILLRFGPFTVVMMTYVFFNFRESLCCLRSVYFFSLRDMDPSGNKLRLQFSSRVVASWI